MEPSTTTKRNYTQRELIQFELEHNKSMLTQLQALPPIRNASLVSHQPQAHESKSLTPRRPTKNTQKKRTKELIRNLLDSLQESAP